MTVVDAPAALQGESSHDPGALGALRDEWTDLWERSPGATPFQSPEWLLPWLAHLVPGAAPWTVYTFRKPASAR